jgi:hypothetical protein
MNWRVFFPPAFLLPVFVIGIWGCLLARLAVSGDLINLQAAKFHGITVGAGILFLLASLAAPFLFAPPLERWPWRRILVLIGQCLILLLPVAAYLVQKPGFTTPNALLDRAWMAAGAKHRSMAKPRLGKLDPALLLRETEAWNPDEPYSLNMIDLFLIEPSVELKERFSSLKVELLGQMLPLEDGKFRLVRLFMVCCAADARPIGLVCYGEAPSQEPGSWATAVGRLRFDDPGERVVLEVSEIYPADAPPDIFVY